MDGFWANATAEAGREFGARHYRWFAGARVARRVAPVLAALAVVAGAILGVQWAVAHWGTAWSTIAAWAPTVGWWALGIAAVVVGFGVVLALAVYLRNNWWRVSLWRPSDLLPFRFRRY